MLVRICLSYICFLLTIKTAFAEIVNVNNEQIALGYLVKNHPDDFAVYSRTNGQHMDIFTELIE